MSEPRFYAVQEMDHGHLRWRVKDHDKPGTIAMSGNIIVPGILTEAEAIKYAKRLNKFWGTS